MSESEQIAVLTARVETLTDAVNAHGVKIDALTAQANRWKGAFFAVLALGGVFGWLADSIIRAFQR